QAFVSIYGGRGVHAVLVSGHTRLFSTSSFRPPLPEDLRKLVRAGELGYEREVLGGVHYVTVAGRAPGSSIELYFFSNEQSVERDLTQLRNVLLAGWLVVLALAALVGLILARRTLEPVAKA